MTPEEVKQLIEKGIPDAEVHVTGEGGKFEATVVSEAFAGLTPVKEHQLVYGTVQEQISAGALHALSIKAYTPDEWRSGPGAP
ncbi:MAG: BolA family protein [Gammaproteobacteria bacterium]